MANRFWVTGGTGNWSSATNWSATSGGASGASVPGSADTATFNASSGAGTATVDSSVTIQTLTMTSFTGTLAFGTNTISLNSTGTVFAGSINYTVTGTPVLNIISTGSTAITVTTASTSNANAISYNFTGGTYPLTFNFSSFSIQNVDFTGFSGTWTSSTTSNQILGNLTFSSTMSTNSANGAISFVSSAGTQLLTTAALVIDSGITINSAGTTLKLVDALTMGSTRTLTLTNGTLDLNGKTLTTGLFSSSNSNTRTLAFGTGNIICNAAGGSLWNTGTATGLTVTGTPTVNISNSGAVATTVSSGALTEANSISFNFTTGAYPLTFLATASYSARNVDFTGFSGTWTGNAAVAVTLYGGLTLSSAMTITAATGVLTFAGTSGTKIITSNGKTLDVPITFSGLGSTFQLADALTTSGAKNLLIQNGTFDGNNKTISGTAVFQSTLSGGTPFIKNISTAILFNITSVTNVITQIGSNTFGDITYAGGTLALGSYTLYCNSFISTTGTRTVAFGTGNITCTGTSGTLFAYTPGTSTITGTPVVNIPYTGSNAIAVFVGGATEAQSISLNFQSGTYPLTFLAGGTGARSVDFTGYSGTWTFTGSGTCTVYGNLTLSSTMTLAAGTAPTLLFQTTSTQTITTNSKTFVVPVGINGLGGTMRLADAFTQDSTRLFTLTNGTLDLNGKTLTVGTQFATGVGTSNLTFNGGTLVCPTAAVTAFNNANPTNFTTTAGTGTGKISMTAATAKTFVGGGSTFNCTLSNDGAGALTVSGSNTFTTIANGVQPTAFTFTAATTQTVTNWNVSGTAGNLVTIISSTAGVPALLSKASGTVSSNYLSLKDSTATGGAAWYAGANSTNVSGNLGWIFTAPPATNTGNFFFMFS